MLCRSGLRGCVGGELGGVPLKFCVDPGGEEFGVSFCVRATGEVLLARGETGVCFLRGVGLIIFLTLSLNDSDLCGEEGSFGEGVPLEEWPGLSHPLGPLSFFNRLKKEGRLLTLPLPLERCLNSLPTLCPRDGARFPLSFRMLVFSSGIVLTLIMLFFLLQSSVITCTCWSPVMDSSLMWVTR